jgi:hypothetical protein
MFTPYQFGSQGQSIMNPIGNGPRCSPRKTASKSAQCFSFMAFPLVAVSALCPENPRLVRKVSTLGPLQVTINARHVAWL